MANKNKNQRQFTVDSMLNMIDKSSNFDSFIGVDTLRLFRTLSKEISNNSLKSMKEIEKRAVELAKKQLEAEKIRISNIQSNAEKQKALELQITRLIEQRNQADEEHYDKIERKRLETEKELTKLKKEQERISKAYDKAWEEYTSEWQGKLKDASARKTPKKGKWQQSIDYSKERIEDLTNRYNTAIEHGNLDDAEYLLGEIKDQTKVLERAEKNQDNITKAVGKIQDEFHKWGSSVQSSLDNLYTEQVKFNARTTSANDAYGNMVEDISSIIGTSPFIKQTDVIRNLNEIANTGSNYNIEQRAYLATLAKDLASTFDIKGEELLRLNRLLHTDMSSVMLGMEQNLTAALNNTFNDSSFMNNLRDSVAGGVLDAQAQLSSGQGTDFTWAVQTWMGALTSAGVSNDVISMLTQGLNYLGSGNVSAMSGNEQMQTLFALAASNAGGKSYSEMLVNGIDASDVNVLMKEMITYLKDISDENKVVQSEYFRILGLGGLSNMTALNNVDVNEVLDIAQNSRTNLNTSYYSTSSMLNRVNIIKENLVTSLAEEIGSNGVMLGTWILSNVLDELAGGIKIPSILGLGTGVVMDTTVADTIRAVNMTAAAFGTLPKIWSSIKNNGVADFGAFQEQAGGIETGFGTSLSYAVGSSSSSDVMKSSVTSQAKTASENKKTIANATGEKEEDSAEKQLKSIKENVDSLNDKTVLIADKFNKMFDKFDDDTNPIKVQVKDFNKLSDAFSPDRVQKVEGTVTLAGFGTDSEKTLNDVLTNAIALALKMIIGGVTQPGANEMTMEGGGYYDGEYIGSMSLMDFLNRIIESNAQTQSQISNTFDYFTQQRDTSYIR